MRILINFILILFFSSPAWATTWYVRDGGGDYGSSSTTCNGLYNVVYVSGQGPNCAVDHPAWILGTAGYNNYGPGGVSQILGGDTLYIDGDSDTSPGSQAIYTVGYGMPNTAGICNSAGKYDCYMSGVPAGSSGHPTSVIGTGTHKPMLLNTQRPYYVLSATSNYVTLQWLELADHDSCAYNDPVNGCASGIAYPDGLQLAGDQVILTDIYIHGFGRYGINGGAFGSANFTRVYTIGNGFGGIQIGSSGSQAVTGTLTFNQPIVDWNGCEEGPYPLAGGIENPSNYTNCFGQASGGYGDGLAYGATGSYNAGNWTIIGPGSISWNTQDGLDILHGNVNATDNIDKMRFEGNAGQQIKITGLTDNITNNIIIGNCGWWQGASQSVSGGMLTGDSCRASGSTIRFAMTDNVSVNFINNTIITNAIALEGNNGSSCTGTTITYKNNIIQGGYSWLDDTTWNGAGGNSQTTNLYLDGSDGNGSGPCGSVVPTEDYNLIYGNKNSNSVCSGAHDVCGTSPNFTPTALFPAGTAGGAESTYYNAWSGITLVQMASNSAAKGAGVTGLTYWNTGTDYYNVTRANPPSIGGLEYASCAVNTFAPCFFNSDCCTGACTNNACSGSPNNGSMAGSGLLGGSSTF